MSQKITPFLWYDKEAEDAVNYYVEVFNGNPAKKVDSKIAEIKRYPDNVPDPHMVGMAGKVLTAVFELEGTQFMAIDAGPTFKFTEAISMLVECETQEEIDYFWGKFSAVPSAEQCGWCKDKFGLSWQITPAIQNWVAGPDKEKAARAMMAMMKMKKLNIQELKDAYDGK